MSLSKKKRFEVFKRDSFTCQYCGEKAPDVVLEADHIEPRSKGGSDDLMNLVTSCRDCNRGKSDRELDDDSVVQKRRQQVEELQDRREQIEMMLRWQKSLSDLEAKKVDTASEFWEDLTNGCYHLNQHGRQEVSGLIDEFGLDHVLGSMRVASNQYLRYDPDESVTSDSVEEALNKLGGICYNRDRWSDDPDQEVLDKAFWSFLRYYRSECSHYPEKWELREWWNNHLAPLIREMDRVGDADKIAHRVVDYTDVEYTDGNHTSYANALQMVIEGLTTKDISGV